MIMPITCADLRPAPSGSRFRACAARLNRHDTVYPITPKNMASAPKKTISLVRTRFPASTITIKVCERLHRRDRLVAVHRPNRVADGVAIVVEFASGPHHESERRGGKLRQRNVHLPLGRGRRSYILIVPYHTHNRADRMLLTNRSSFPIGSWFGQNCRASVSLIIADGALPCASAESNTRPLISSICIAEK